MNVFDKVNLGKHGTLLSHNKISYIYIGLFLDQFMSRRIIYALI